MCQVKRSAVSRSISSLSRLRTDPVVEAHLAWMEDRGIDPFTSYQLPLATLTLKQWVGRLIRHRRDRGLLAILDIRLIRKPYGARLLKDLPPCPITHDLSDVEGFFRNSAGSAPREPADP